MKNDLVFRNVLLTCIPGVHDSIPSIERGPLLTVAGLGLACYELIRY